MKDILVLLATMGGGLGCFLLGMKHLSEGLQSVGGAGLKRFMSAMTTNRIAGLATGIVSTIIVQSSSIITVMTVGFVSSGLMDLTQAVNVIIGSNIGTTATAWLIAYAPDVRLMGFVAVTLGSILYFGFRREGVHNSGLALIGLGLVFVGLYCMNVAIAPLKKSEAALKLFATLDPTTRKLSLPSGKEVLLTDTVGFIQKLPHSLVSAFRATLEETAFADVLLHIHDASSPQREEQARVVHKIVTDLHAAELPIIDVFNKADLLSEVQLQLLKNQYPSALFISAEKQKGLSALLTAVEKALKVKWKVRPLRISAKQADLLGQIYTRSLVLSRTPTNDGGLELKIMATDGNYAELRKKTSAN